MRGPNTCAQLRLEPLPRSLSLLALLHTPMLVSHVMRMLGSWQTGRPIFTSFGMAARRGDGRSRIGVVLTNFQARMRSSTVTSTEASQKQAMKTTWFRVGACLLLERL